MTTKKSKNKYVIVRTTGAGVHAGVLVSRKGTEVILTEARRIWRWDTTEDKVQAKTLSDVSRIGPGSKAKVSAPVEEIVILGVHEIIICTAEGEKALREAPPWQ